MRTTLSLDDDVVAYARAHARKERRSLGEVVSTLARRGIASQERAPQTVAEPQSRYALLPSRNETITPEHVRALMDQEGL